MASVRITVLKKAFYPDIADEYILEGRSIGPCPILNEGDSFVYEGGAQMPEGLCPWAWISLYTSVAKLSAGGGHPDWNIRANTQIQSCSDGVRPVTFLVERIEEQ